jgi:hypothetical protein
MSKENYDRLYCSSSSTTLFYALIKTHKENNPIRPIVSFIGSPSYMVRLITVWNEVEMFEYSRIHIVETKQGLSGEYQSNFPSMAKRKSMTLIRPNSMCFWEPSWCDRKIPPFSAIILQTRVIRPKWCEKRAKSMHFTLPILNRLERGSNARILQNIYRWNQTRFIERISVELHFYGWTKVKASNST